MKIILAKSLHCDECIAEEVKKKKWRYAINHYNGTIKILWKKGQN